MEDRIKAKIIEAVPEIMERVSCGSPCQCFQGHSKARSITLADVLRAIASTKGKPASYAVDEFGRIRVRKDDEVTFSWVAGEHDIITWNLATDYDGQTQEVKEFIGSLLGGDAKSV